MKKILLLVSVASLGLAGCSNTGKTIGKEIAESGTALGGQTGATQTTAIARAVVNAALSRAPNPYKTSTNITITNRDGGSATAGITTSGGFDTRGTGTLNVFMTLTFFDWVAVIGGEGGGLVMKSPPAIQFTSAASAVGFTFTSFRFTMNGGVTVFPKDINKKLDGQDFFTVTFNMSGTTDGTGKGSMNGTVTVTKPGGSIVWEGDISAKI